MITQTLFLFYKNNLLISIKFNFIDGMSPIYIFATFVFPIALNSIILKDHETFYMEIYHANQLNIRVSR